MKDQKKKILLIEDSKDITITLSGLLEMKGFEVISAGNGVEGLEKAKREKPNLILLDLMLPKLSGFEVCKMLKTDDLTWRIPVVVMSTLDSPADVDRAKEMGADHFISKPYDIEEVIAQAVKFIR